MCSKLPIRSLERPYSIADFEQVNASWIVFREDIRANDIFHTGKDKRKSY